MLKELFSSSARVQILSLLLLNSDTKFYQREIETITGLAIRSIQRETENLEALGVIHKSTDTNKVYFQGNRDYSSFPELRRMLLKTVGSKVVLADAQADNQVKVALIHGPFASERERLTDPIAIFVVGDISKQELQARAEEVQSSINREITCYVRTPQSFRSRVQLGYGFVANVLAGPKLFLIGDKRTLRSLATGAWERRVPLKRERAAEVFEWWNIP
ncbi:MAG: hypothetical protein WBW48_08590 [Anaerolineae bacterium]